MRLRISQRMGYVTFHSQMIFTPNDSDPECIHMKEAQMINNLRHQIGNGYGTGPYSGKLWPTMEIMECWHPHSHKNGSTNVAHVDSAHTKQSVSLMRRIAELPLVKRFLKLFEKKSNGTRT